MGKNTKRTKRYNPKRFDVRIPITRELLNTFGQDLHFSLFNASTGHFNRENFDKIGGSFNLIWAALSKKPPKDHAVMAVIEGAMRAMNQCGTRGDRTGIWTLTALEQAAVQAGVEKAEEALPYLDVMALYRAQETCKELRAQELKAA